MHGSSSSHSISNTKPKKNTEKKRKKNQKKDDHETERRSPSPHPPTLESCKPGKKEKKARKEKTNPPNARIKDECRKFNEITYSST
jgi:hypothetical protein